MIKFSQPLKNKKLLFFVFLFIFIFAVKINFAQAADCPSGDSCYCMENTCFPYSNAAIAIGGNPVGIPCLRDVDCAPSPTGDCPGVDNLSYGKQVAVSLIDAVAAFPNYIAKTAGSLASIGMGTVLTYPITNPSSGSGPISTSGATAFVAGWKSMRDLANMLVALGFVIIGIATALRIREYEAGKALMPLIIVAILINFSLLFCGLIIDASNVTMNGLLGGGSTVTTSGFTAPSMGTALYQATLSGEYSWKCQAVSAESVSGYALVVVAYSFLYMVIAFAFLYLFLVILARYAVLGILFMLSPLGFIFWAFPFPGAKELGQKWWNHFLKWSFVGVSMCLFLNLALGILNNTPSLNGTQTPTVETVIEPLFIVIMVIVVGIYISAKSNGIASMASKAVIGVATGGAALAGGAIVAGAAGGSKMLNKMTGGKVADAGRRISNATGRVLAKVGLADREAVDAKASAPLQEAKKAMSGASKETLTSHAQGKGIGVTEQKRVASIEAMIQKGDIGDIGDTAAQHAAVSRVENYHKTMGTSADFNVRKTAEDQNYKLAGFNEANVTKLRSSQPGLTDAAAKDKLVQTKLDETLPAMTHTQLRNIDAPHLTSERVSRLTPEKLSAFRTGSKDQIDQIQGPDVRGKMDSERINLETDKHAGQRIDEAKLSKLNNQVKEIDNLA